MAQTPAKIDLQKFLSDPSYQNDREFLESFFDHVIEKKRKAAEEAAAADAARQPPNFFDRLFGAK